MGAGVPSTIADTAVDPVTAANRSYIWNHNIQPPPKPNSLKISFMALGEWYDLYDDGFGKIEGLEAGIGTGTIDYVSGTSSITLSALPDAETAIVYSWGKEAQYLNRSSVTPSKIAITIQLDDTGISNGTLIITWNDGTARTATADGTNNITGDATGSINVQTGIVTLIPNNLPLGGQQFTLDYDKGTPLSETVDITPSNGIIAFSLANTNITPSSVSIVWSTYVPRNLLGLTKTKDESTKFSQSLDDGLGGLVTPTLGSHGTINYATGVISFDSRSLVDIQEHRFVGSTSNVCPGVDGSGDRNCTLMSIPVYISTGIAPHVSQYLPTGGSIVVNYRMSDSETSGQKIVTINTLDFDLTPGYSENIVSGSVRFDLGGKTYIDRNGLLYHTISATTGAGTYAGTVDYNLGTLSLEDWTTQQTNSIVTTALLTTFNVSPVNKLDFKIPSAPVLSQSLTIRANSYEDGTLLNITSNADSSVSGDHTGGIIDYQTGLVNLVFGDWMLVSGNEGEDWYDPANIDPDDPTRVWKEHMVDASSVLYNATSQTFLPLDESTLGLNPVRLPVDGRIPIYSDGDVVVILNNQITGGTFITDQVLDLGRGRISKLSIRDSANQEILATKYVADLDTGIITFGDLTGVSQPLTITDRIEDMALLTDVQITGTLSLSQPLTHDFPIEGTLVSNAVIFGDKFAHTSIPFDQETWTGVWSDTLIGSEVSAQFNNTQFPVTVDNASCLQEEWYFVFTSSTVGNLVGRNVGQVISGANISADIAPINPNTSQPYFTIPLGGWGSGWSAGNILRFNTYGANASTWCILSVGQGEATDPDFDFGVEVRGDVDTP